jgi:hypothetical protein
MIEAEKPNHLQISSYGYDLHVLSYKKPNGVTFVQSVSGATNFLAHVISESVNSDPQFTYSLNNWSQQQIEAFPLVVMQTEVER